MDNKEQREISKHNQQLFDKLRDYNLPLGEYAIVASGPLAARNIRKANDIDIIITDKLFSELAKKYEKQIAKNNEVTVEVLKLSEDIEALHFLKETIKNDQPTQDEQINSAEVIDGLSFQSLKDCIFFKKWSGREKDKNDLKLVEAYLEKHPEEANSL